MRYVASAAGGAALALLVAVAALWSFDLRVVKAPESNSADEGGTSIIQVPDVTGLRLVPARATIEATGLKVRESGVENSAYNALYGSPLEVKRQIPPSGSEVPPDATVTLILGFTGKPAF